MRSKIKKLQFASSFTSPEKEFFFYVYDVIVKQKKKALLITTDNKMSDDEMQEVSSSQCGYEEKNCGYFEMYGDVSPQQHEAQDVGEFDNEEMQVDADGEAVAPKSGMTFGKACIVPFTGNHTYFNDPDSGDTTVDGVPPWRAGSAVLTSAQI